MVKYKARIYTVHYGGRPIADRRRLKSRFKARKHVVHYGGRPDLDRRMKEIRAKEKRDARYKREQAIIAKYKAEQARKAALKPKSITKPRKHYYVGGYPAVRVPVRPRAPTIRRIPTVRRPIRRTFFRWKWRW